MTQRRARFHAHEQSYLLRVIHEPVLARLGWLQSG